MNSQEVVRDHFDRDAQRFDAIYEEKKPLWQRWMDRFRRVVVERFELVRAVAPLPGDWSVLDVGCGPGRYGLALADRGAKRIVGVDVAPAMIEIARAEAESRGGETEFAFFAGDYLDFATDERFDAVIAMGYFDYLESPGAHLARMREHCRGRIFASFPKRFEWRVPIRRLRFLLVRGFVRFYSRAEVEATIREAGLPRDRVHLVDLGRDWILVANCVPDRA